MDGLIRNRLIQGAVALTLALGLSGQAARAQAPPSPLAPSTAAGDLASALERTRGQGIPTVVIATASANPQSKALYREICESAWARSYRGLVQVVELPTESNPSLAQSFQIKATPTVVAYVAGPEGVSCRGRRVGGMSGEAVTWLESLRLVSMPTTPTQESGVVQARFDGGYPSAQQSTPQAPPVVQPPPFTPSPLPVQALQPVYQPQNAQPAMMIPQVAPSAFVQVPGQDIVVQQAQPRVFLAPPAMGYVAQTPAPTMGFVPQPAAPMAGNLFLPAAAAAAPLMGVAAVPAPAPVAAPAAPVVAAAPPGFAITNQTVGLPTGGTTTRTRVRGPGPVRYGLSRVGERLVQLGRTRVETVNETVLHPSQVQGGSGIATFSTSSAMPVAVPQNQTQILAIPVAAPPPSQPEYEAPRPSPQEGSSRGHFFKRH
ncbi:MAG: hypothetical protein JWN86_3421 [Planctomycetota bacterium]|nr:hypothetical protein [Planctomycetota bacterium]